jgi:hypothetical protein
MVKRWTLFGLLLILSGWAFGDSVTMGLSSGSTTLTPGVDQLLVTTDNSIGFDAFAGPGPYTVSWGLTFTIPNQPAQVVMSSFTCSAGNSACGLVFSLTVPTTYKPIPFTFVEEAQFSSGLKLSETYNEHFITPVPEPMSLLLVAMGLPAIGWRRFQAASRKGRRLKEFSVPNSRVGQLCCDPSQPTI